VHLKPVLAALVIAVLHCGNAQSTQDLLDAKFVRFAAIELISPINDSVVGQNPEFAWSQDQQGLNYKIEIAEDAEFKRVVVSRQIEKKVYALANSDLINISALDAIEYFWRVSLVNGRIASSIRRIQVTLPQVVFVDGSSSKSNQFGNKTYPYKTISDGLSAADGRRTSATAAMEVRVSRDNPGPYVEFVQMRPGISLLGGYDAAQGWLRSIETFTTTIKAKTSPAVAFGTNTAPATLETTRLEGFNISAKLTGSSTAIASEKGYGVIQNNVIRSQAPNFAYGVSDSSGGLRISSNILHVEGAAAVSGIRIVSPDGTTVTNNVIFATGSTNHAAIDFFGAGTSPPIISNNSVISIAPTGFAICINIQIQNTQFARMTNNLLLPLIGTTRYGLFEPTNASNPGTFENNAILNAGTSGTFYTYGNNTPTTDYTDLTFQSPTLAFNSGPDKGRNNLQPTAGANTIPFASFPTSIDMTNSTSASATTFRVASGAAYSNGFIVELASDGIARKITCAGACGTTISFTPAFDESTVPGTRSIRIWANNVNAQNCYQDASTRGKVCKMLDASLVQAAGATAQDWADLRYGGKNTAQSVCGAAAGGVAAAGPGVQSCGSVDSDASGMNRTPVVSQATSNGAGAAGFSIGAYEAD